MKDIEVLEQVQRGEMELRKGLEHKSCEEWLRGLGDSAWKKECSEGTLTLSTTP